MENGDTLINCLAYIDLNPIRAGMVERPEDYRWCSIEYYVQSGNKNDFLSTDFGLNSYGDMTETERLRDCNGFLYEKGALDSERGAAVDDIVAEKEKGKNYELTTVDRLRFKSRYF